MDRRVAVPAALLVAFLLTVLVWTDLGRLVERPAPSRGDPDPETRPIRGSEPAVISAAPAPTTTSHPVRDLADGSAIEGVSFVPGRGLDPGDTGLVVASREEEILTTGVAWVRRELRIIGTVEGRSLRGELDPREVAVLVRVEIEPSSGRPGPDWLAGHGLAGPFIADPPGPDGAFFARVPRIGGLVAEASAPGWTATRAPVPVSAAATEVEVALRLCREIHLSGHLVDAEGRPVPGALVMGYVLLRVPADHCAPGPLGERYPEGGVASVRRGGEETARLTLHHQTRTDGNGTFRLALREGGEVRLLALPPGGAPVERSFGEVTADLEAIDLAGSPAPRPGATIRIVQDGRPLTGVRVAVSDQSDPEVAPGWVSETDGEGRIAADWLIPGRFYAFTLLPAGDGSPAGRVVLPWRDQGEVPIPRPGVR
jgi:hypothetical protein